MVLDHKGNSFDSIQEMCEYWNTHYALYVSRRRAGWTLAKTLEMPLRQYECVDPYGNTHKSISSLCEAYKCPKTSFAKRKREGEPLSVCLGIIPSLNMKTHTIYNGVPISFAYTGTDGKLYFSYNKTVMEKFEVYDIMLEVLTNKQNNVTIIS